MIYINTFIENYYIFVRAKRAKKAIGYKLKAKSYRQFEIYAYSL